MEKLVQDLKKGFLQMVDAVKGYTTTKGNGNMEESKLESAEQVTVVEVEDRAIRLNAPKPPTRPGVPKGPPAQTQSKDQ
ncbi:hypothetical protein ACOSQ2_022312 [Xanthoceras sorbifolium]|uniref:Uncharacterized protein n=1 Tax=Xanthoceras sorbifolium TaxID=99658 RepID=A0ABQ8HNI5_9ROSI|nr:hypothetical protein JRO89_XS08G0033100 [Xanthoceras sorbifolium]